MISMEDEKYRKRFESAKTAVFWDVDGCQIPDGGYAIDVSHKIRSALKEKKCHGTVTIYAYGDKEQILRRLESDAIMETLKKTGDEIEIEVEEKDYRGTAYIYANQIQAPEIVLNHTPAGDKDARLKKFLLGLFRWAVDNPAPANLMIILQDISTHNHHQFVGAFQRLKAAGYNIMLVQPKDAPPRQLFGAVREKFIWESLSEAGNLDNVLEPSTPKHWKPIRFLLTGAWLAWLVFSFSELARFFKIAL